MITAHAGLTRATVVALTSLLAVALGAVLTTSTAPASAESGSGAAHGPVSAAPAQAAPRTSTGARPPCGAPLPPGWTVTAAGLPDQGSGAFGARVTPQGTSLLVNAVWRDPRTNRATKVCLAKWAVGLALASSSTRVATAPDGRQVTARLFPYPYTFSAHPMLAPLRPGWVSALGQSSMLGVLARLYDETGERAYLDAATETFNAFHLTVSEGGVTTRSNGVTYFQEYVTDPPTDVLNGFMSAQLVLMDWAARTGDPAAVRLGLDGLRALHRTAELEKVHLPAGTASSYDLMRGWTAAAPLRWVPATASTPAPVSDAVVVDGDGRELSFAELAVATPAPAAPNRLVNADLRSWSGGRPTAWTVSGVPAHGLVAPGPTPRSVVLTSDGAARTALLQSVAKVPLDTLFALSWRASIAHLDNVPQNSAIAVLRAVCGTTARIVAAAEIRSTNRALQSVSGVVPAGCAPQAMFTQVDLPLRSTVEISAPVLSVADPRGAAVAPDYPISVLQTPVVALRFTYSGAGSLQGWVDGRWTTIAALPAATGRTVTVPIPDWMQGRAVNTRYHNEHVVQLAALYRRTGDPQLRSLGLEYLAYAPAEEAQRAVLEQSVPANPLWAAAIGG